MEMGLNKTTSSETAAVLNPLVFSYVVKLKNLLKSLFASILSLQANKDYWKFDFKSADENKWNYFNEATSANTVMFSVEFAAAIKFSDLDVM
ncbi:hypothetical protein G9A89_007118 [Geosiphon pyriformis]|nr:hypothetical protein G9A89_007118 [Geosiphon pyriformis]